MKSVTVNLTVSAQWRETQGKMTSSWAHPLDLCYKRGKHFPRGEKGEPNTRWKRGSREVCVCVCVFWSPMTHLHRSVSLSKMRWVSLLTHSHFSLFPLLFLFMGRLASDRGVLGGLMPMTLTPAAGTMADGLNSPALICLTSSPLGCVCVCVCVIEGGVSAGVHNSWHIPTIS